MSAVNGAEYVKVLPGINRPQFMKSEVTAEAKIPGLAEAEVGCFYCGKHANHLCNWCRSVYYCCPEHYKHHRNKSKCYPFRIAGGSGGQRRLVASRDIR